jgi:NAD(P)-dependent dehydrogenase (short-subunit alcohol dehydrogenase family)
MKIAMITGGSRGLGRNAALRLARRGVDVILTYHTKVEEAQAVVQEIEGMGRRALALKLDTSMASSFPEFAVELKKVLKEKWNAESFDYLLNNAGTGLHASFEETTEAQFDQIMNIHFKGTFFLTQKLLPLLKDGGSILNVSSGLARFSLPGSSAYASMKGAVEVLTRYLAKELGPRKISVNVIAPGAIETDFSGGAVRDNEALNKFVASQTALGRAGLPEDIGEVMASILIDMKWVTGQRIEASGGMFL